MTFSRLMGYFSKTKFINGFHIHSTKKGKTNFMIAGKWPVDKFMVKM